MSNGLCFKNNWKQTLETTDANELIYKTERLTEVEMELMVAGRKGRKERELGMEMHTLPNLKWITNKDLLNSTGSSMVCGTLGVKGVWERMDTCVCVYIYIYIVESLCCPPETITTMLIGYTLIQN